MSIFKIFFFWIVNILHFLFYVFLNHICLGNVICICSYNIQIDSCKRRSCKYKDIVWGYVYKRVYIHFSCHYNLNVITISCFHHSLVCFDIKMFREKSFHNHRMFFLFMFILFLVFSWLIVHDRLVRIWSRSNTFQGILILCGGLLTLP